MEEREAAAWRAASRGREGRASRARVWGGGRARVHSFVCVRVFVRVFVCVRYHVFVRVCFYNHVRLHVRVSKCP